VIPPLMGSCFLHHLAVLTARWLCFGATLQCGLKYFFSGLSNKIEGMNFFTCKQWVPFDSFI
jgi:hypothetical protein